VDALSSENRKFMGLGSREAWIASIVVILIAALIFAVSVANIRNMGDTMWEEAAKASLNLVTGIILGGFLKLLLDAHSRAQETRTQRSDFRLGIITRLEAIIDQLETARLLINAHRSVRTYEEQMRQLLAVRASVLDVQRSIEAVRTEMDDADQVLSHINQMDKYLAELGAEYKNEYPIVAKRQRYDEALTRSRIENSVRNGDEEPPPLEEKAWAMLCKFPVLNGFLKDYEEGDEYHEKVVYSCAKAVALLRGKLLSLSVQPSY
jgi:hypothetical protein